MWTPDDDENQSSQPGLLRMNYPNSQQWQHPGLLQSVGSFMSRFGGGAQGGQGGGYGGYGGSDQSAIAGPLRRKLFSGVSSFFL